MNQRDLRKVPTVSNIYYLNFLGEELKMEK